MLHIVVSRAYPCFIHGSVCHKHTDGAVDKGWVSPAQAMHGSSNKIAHYESQYNSRKNNLLSIPSPLGNPDIAKKTPPRGARLWCCCACKCGQKCGIVLPITIPPPNKGGFYDQTFEEGTPAHEHATFVKAFHETWPIFPTANGSMPSPPPGRP
jgi:hypothetical protein